MGFTLDEAERSWQAECIYGLFKRYYDDIEFVLKDRKLDDGILRITNFENCRERGYTIKLGEKEVSFAENRNSDDIVVYPFKWNDLENSNKEADYDHNTKYFKYQQFHEVFDYIIEYLGIEL